VPRGAGTGPDQVIGGRGRGVAWLLSRAIDGGWPGCHAIANDALRAVNRRAVSRGCQTVAVDGNRSRPLTTGCRGGNPYFTRPFVRSRPSSTTHGRIRIPLGL